MPDVCGVTIAIAVQREGNLSAAAGLVPRQPISHIHAKRRGSFISSWYSRKKGQEGTDSWQGMKKSVLSSGHHHYMFFPITDFEYITMTYGGCLLFHRCSTTVPTYLPSSSWIAI